MFCLIFWFLCSSVTENPVKDVDSTIKVTMNGSNQVANLPHFWCSSGFCPPQPHQNIADYVLSNDMEQNIGLIGSLPSKCDSFQLRVHWLLNLIQVEPAIRRNLGLKSHPKLNFKNLDHFIRLLHKHGLKPGFEVMGNPSNYYSDLDDHRQLRSWSKLVHYTVSRYVKLFGFDYVQSWNFETWNEPDNGDFDGLNFTSESFLKYYEATRAGLDAVSKSLVLGGPGERCLPVRNDSLCWTLADKLVKSSSNYFLSFHEKGAEDESASIVSKESEIIEHLSRRYPGEELTVYNNEADPVRTWSKARPWQADTTYAAIMVRSVSEHVEHYFRRNGNHSVKFGLLSNDNAFLSYFPHQFDQRTLLARFQMNNSQANYTFFIKKPIYAATGLLGLLGNKLLQSESTDDLVRVIATETEEESFVILLVSGDSTTNQTRRSLNLTASVDLTSNRQWKAMQLTVDDASANPVSVWRKAGSPSYPSHRLIKKMRAAEGPFLKTLDVALNCSVNETCSWTKALTINQPAINVLIICHNETASSARPTDVKAIKVTEDEVLIVWKPLTSSCIETYIVEFSKNGSDDFKKISWVSFVFPSFYYRSSKLPGYVRIKAVDLHGRQSRYSKVVRVD